MSERENTPIFEAEATIMQDVRKKYEDDGYQVLTRLPVTEADALSAYRPDLIFQKGDEIVVVEMKRTVETRNSSDLRTLRNQIERHPGWHLRILSPRNSSQKEPVVRRSADKLIDDYKKREERARQALRKGYLEEAIVLLWIAVEGLLRAYFSKSGEPPNKGITVLSMLRRLHEEGVLDDSEMKLLARGYDARNLAVHALKVVLTKATARRIFAIVDSLVTRLLATSGRPHQRRRAIT
jgi:hypothetical protein